jgi:hypothetical protein
MRQTLMDVLQAGETLSSLMMKIYVDYYQLRNFTGNNADVGIGLLTKPVPDFLIAGDS